MQSWTIHEWNEILAALKESLPANSYGMMMYGLNNPNWRGVREVFYPCIQDLLYGDKTPGEVAKELDEDCNAAIDAGYAESKLHE